MGLFRKHLIAVKLVCTTLLGGMIISSCASIPKLSKSDKQVIKTVMNSTVPQIVKGETGFVTSGSHRIWFERIQTKKPTKGSVLLIMGHGNDALSWPTKFISDFVNNGYDVIRFDHRGTGLSTSSEKWKKKNAYTLTDMSEDVVAILKNLKLEKAHIVGVSMGGMIAQLAAINHPDKIESLTLIMTTGNAIDDELGPMSEEVLPQMISAVLKHGAFGGKKGKMKLQVIQRRILMGEATGEIDVKEMVETSRYNQEKRDGYHFMTARHHQQAILLSTSRYKALGTMQIPTLVVHGKQDPVIPIAHGEKLAATISNSNSLWVDNMGHDLPDSAIPEICDKMMVHFEQAQTILNKETPTHTSRGL